MAGQESHEAGFQAEDEWRFTQQLRRRRRQQEERAVPRPGYLIELSGQPIALEYLEFRILRFLSSHPYKAFTREQIVNAVSSPANPLTAESLDQHIHSLRDKLGLFSDYVQSVPYIGYRFKE